MSRLINRSIPYVRGRRIALSRPRRFIGDLLHFSHKIPAVPAQRTMRLADLVAARASWSERVSWCAIFIKAYAIVAARRPELRRTFLPFPWARLYEHPCNVASFTIERQYQGEDEVFFAKIAKPELISLTTLDAIIRAYKTADIEKVDSFRQALNLSGLPKPLRRLAWWVGLETYGPFKAYHFGTFGVSVVSSFGASSVFLLSPLTTTLNYGVFEPDGRLDVRLTYDHRVVDGAKVARAMTHLEEVLLEEVRAELLAGPGSKRLTTNEALEAAQQAAA